jgi:hypothetical protein
VVTSWVPYYTLHATACNHETPYTTSWHGYVGDKVQSAKWSAITR